jgi:hypothetical protein
LEVIIYKRERDENRRRAIDAVLSEQHRQRRQQDANEATTDISQMNKMNPMVTSFSQQRISDRYKLLTYNSLDDAYLRGLKDAQEAREIFEESLNFPSFHIDQLLASKEAKLQSNMKKQPTERDVVGPSSSTELRNATMNDLVSLQRLLQENSLLRNAAASSNTTNLEETEK